MNPSDKDARHQELQQLGSDMAGYRDMALLGEGNVSARLDRHRMLVKASGTSLAHLTHEALVEVRTAPLIEAVRGTDRMDDAAVEALLLQCRVDPTAAKPSVETLFHAWLLQLPGIRYVGHAHPIAVNQILCSPHGRAFAEKRLFPDHVVYCGPASVLIPYVDPGLVLARSIAEGVDRYLSAHDAPPKLILLENHGLIALGGYVNDVRGALMMAEKAACVFVGAVQVGGPVFLSSAQVARIADRVDEHYRQRILQAQSPTVPAPRRVR